MVGPRGKEPTMRIGGRVSVALAALALALVLAACGGEDGEAEAAATDDRQQAMLAFAECMREQGIDVPDPQEGRLRVRPRSGGAPSEAERSEFEEANKKCREHLEGVGPPELSEEDRVAVQEAMLAFARCMRENGVNVPDPEFGKGGGFFRIVRGGDPEDPDFKAAEKTCREHLEAIEERFGPERRAP
jgi:hypothetical protein